MSHAEGEGAPAITDHSETIGSQGGDRGSPRLGDSVHTKDEERRYSGRAFAFLAVALTLGGAGLTVALFMLISASPWGGTLGIPADSVTVVIVTVDFGFNRTGDGSSALGLDAIGLPHCSFGGFDDRTSRLILSGTHYDAAVSTVLILSYRGRESFSGGGDDRRVVFLRDGEVATVVAAWNASTELYRVNPQNRDLFEPIATARPERDLLVATYKVNFTEGVLNGDGPGIYEVEEHHLSVQHRDVPVFLRNFVCM